MIKIRIEIRSDKVILDGYVNAVDRDSRPIVDSSGEVFIERIVPKTFQRAIEKSEEIFCLLNHNEDRVMASTKQGNLELFEDNIGLRAICEITDEVVIDKAREQKLRGWSFGFESLKETEEPVKDCLKRRFVEDMNLLEVSIIDDRKIPCYVGTSIEIRANDKRKIEYRCEYFKPKYFQNYQVNTPDSLAFDYTPYEKILNKIESIKLF